MRVWTGVPSSSSLDTTVNILSAAVKLSSKARAIKFQSLVRRFLSSELVFFFCFFHDFGGYFELASMEDLIHFKDAEQELQFVTDSNLEKHALRPFRFVDKLNTPFPQGMEILEYLDKIMEFYPQELCKSPTTKHYLIRAGYNIINDKKILSQISKVDQKVFEEMWSLSYNEENRSN